MKGTLFKLTAALLFAATTNAIASCVTDPLYYTGRTVSVSTGEDNAPGRSHIAGFRGLVIGGVNYCYLDVYPSLLSAWTGTGFDANKITDRVVSGDFDHDGKADDIAAIYDNGGGSVSIRTWSFEDGQFDSYSSTAWTATGFDATKVTGRVVSGDFDCDGYFDDIAAFYDYGSGAAKIYVWKGSGSSFTSEWWLHFYSGYYVNQITGRVVSGDFDHDGYYDDIATMYDIGGGGMTIHMFKGNGDGNPSADGTSFSYEGAWWSVSSGYSPSNISFRVVSGNFNHSFSVWPVHHKSDDIVAIYDYGSGAAKAHVWTSTGTGFSYSWKWEISSGFNAANITDRFVSYGFSNETADRTFGMMALYNYGAATDVLYRWDANTSSPWNFNSITPALCPSSRLAESASLENEEATAPALTANVFPNPCDGRITLEIAPTNEEGMTSMVILDLSGREVYSNSVCTVAGYREEIDLTPFGKGVYLLQIVGPGDICETKKIIVQ